MLTDLQGCEVTVQEEILLAQARLLADKHEALADATGQSFSLFAILDRETDEVQTHSAILCELLNPNGTHRQGTAFLKAFLNRLHEQLQIDVVGAEAARVWRESKISEGSRADILVEIGDETMIVIENKIHAGDRHAQLERYHAYADGWHNGKVVYLTLHGDKPSAESLGRLSLEQVICISYETDVVGWLDDCIKEVARMHQLREILVHYQTLLRKLTGKATGELTMELRELLLGEHRGKYNFEVAPNIAEAMAELSIEVEWTKFWQPLRDQLLQTTDGPWRLKSDDGLKAVAKEVDANVVRHAHGNGQNKWRYGWTFAIESDTAPARYRTGNREVLLRVECDGDGWGFYGFIASTRNSDGRVRIGRQEHMDLFNEWSQLMSPIEEGWWYTNADSWLAWAWPSENIPLQKTRWLNPHVMRALIRGETVPQLVKEICTTINKIEQEELAG